ncbi:MAG: hypothetical protein QGF53_00995, partial [Alphaproteobacteria bacterium]|nr:hypothetical protein [Alphaproteobacteria bacterium]
NGPVAEPNPPCGNTVETILAVSQRHVTMARQLPFKDGNGSESGFAGRRRYCAMGSRFCDQVLRDWTIVKSLEFCEGL